MLGTFLPIELLWHAESIRAISLVPIELLWHAESIRAISLVWHGAPRRRGSAPQPRFRP
jgi:hypothetical protein